ncbi:metal ABC transporter substrate-binding protein [Micromonospora marina]|uniref:Zinc transport system substrate-binding protein n=1 Tax=Micromonospora marina TaxID=307120 RepID=A0A1C4ZTR9_9ACTN|nr:metal ABC transporter substrate-binding protein [Micromonospora marina]SCF36407.1 zinc transport system substrate-binding protein [Micromonospora marina]
MTVRTSRRILTTTAAALLAAAGLTACADDSGDVSQPGEVGVVAAFYPLQFLAERIGGDAVTVSNLTKPGAEPHDLELNPRQVGEVVDADLVVYLSGFQPAVDEAVEQNGGDHAFDVAGVTPLRDAAAGDHDHDHEGEGEDEHAEDEHAEDEHAEEGGGKDPHVWLDPTRLATIGDKLAERLGKADPDHAADYTARAGALRTELTKLDTEYADGLRTCQRREIVTSHAAFGYLTDRYKLEQIGISGLTPEAEPSPQRLAEVAEEAREHQAGTIFFETLVSPKVAETIAREVGAKTAVLDPLEGPPADGDYLSAMRTNLQTLRTALGCS